ncbi:hypothetical protein JJE73_26815 [Comamonas sp. JC664]|nr:hypothetical protein [Comamonas sp. JC664]GHG83454.1 hypothetical protein GCM10012319_38410 [Comamonas sp. KCTC 72670]
MCSACGRPQSAGRPRCIACEALLPEAPLPGGPAPGQPFLQADLGGGRMLSGEGTRLLYQPHPSVMVPPVELGSLREVRLESHFFKEALALLAFVALGAIASVLVLKVFAFGMAALGTLLAVTCRSHVLVLEPREGRAVHWPLGLARRGSSRDARLLSAWGALAEAMRARGIPVHGPGVEASPADSRGHGPHA